jgi:hypothetical protein
MDKKKAGIGLHIRPVDEFDVIVGMTEADARAHLYKHGIKTIRIASRDREPAILSMDISDGDRVDLYVIGEKVYRFDRS